MTLRPILRAYASACEDLLSIGHTLADEECSFLEYYVKELSRDLLSNNPTVETVIAESHKVNRSGGPKTSRALSDSKQSRSKGVHPRPILGQYGEHWINGLQPWPHRS
jgi:hypothetical protein